MHPLPWPSLLACAEVTRLHCINALVDPSAVDDTTSRKQVHPKARHVLGSLQLTTPFERFPLAVRVARIAPLGKSAKST